MAFTLKQVRREIQDILQDDAWGTGIQFPEFTGSGLDDMSNDGQYSGIAQKKLIRVTIDGTGPDTFKWERSTDNGENWTTVASTVAITGSEQTLEDGITITFAATTGHTSTDLWKFQVSKPLHASRLTSFINDAQLEVADLIEIKRNLTSGVINTYGAKASGTGIAFVDSNPDTITDTESGFGSFVVGQKIRVIGSTSNDGEYTVAAVAAGTLTLDSSDSLTAEAAGDSVIVVSDYVYDMPSDFFKLSPTFYVNVKGNDPVTLATRELINATDEDHTDNTTASSGPDLYALEESQILINPVWTGILQIQDYYKLPTELSAETDTINLVSDGISGDRLVKNAIVSIVCARVYYEWIDSAEKGRVHSDNKRRHLGRIEQKYSHNSGSNFVSPSYPVGKNG
jgi:hypothetical protein